MKAIDFPQVNLRLAENQPEYETLPVFADVRTVQTEKGPRNVVWSMTVCYELSDEEIAEIIANKKLFYRQMLFGEQFQPVFLSTKDPFIPANAEHWPADV
jgi:hypothetical protein